MTWHTRLPADPTAWLLREDGPPWARYRAMNDLGIASVDHDDREAAREALVAHPLVETLCTEAAEWLPKAPGRNNDPKLAYFKLRILSDLGLTTDDPQIRTIVDAALEHRIDGYPAVRGGHPERRKRNEPKPDPTADVWHIAPCNAPHILATLLRLGVHADGPDLRTAAADLASRWETPQGWFCHYFFVDGQFKKFNAGCPMAGLMALEVFATDDALRESQAARNAFAPLKFHYELGTNIYYFGRAKRFWTFKYPLVWYNALYLADVLSRFAFTRDEPLMHELIEWVEAAADEHGRWKPTSMFRAYKGWDFADKKQPSPWMTLLCTRILKRYYSNSNSNSRDNDTDAAAETGNETDER